MRAMPPPSGSTDDGSADPRLSAALAGGDEAEVAAALVDARLIVAVVALPGEEHASEGEMALGLLEVPSGARALPAFTSLEALGRWRRDARPVPRSAVELAAAVQAENLATLVLDVAGPVPWALSAEAVAALSTGHVPAGESFAARRADPTLRAPSWQPTEALRAACAGLEIYAVDVEIDGAGGPVRGPALALVPPIGQPPAPLAERLLTAAGQQLDLLLLDEPRRREAAEVGQTLG